jgi:hypothetical protein
MYKSVGATPVTDPEPGEQGEVVPGRCGLPTCTVSLVLQGPSGLEHAQFTDRD